MRSKLDLPPQTTQHTCFNVLGYGFHFMDRIEVAMHHTYTKVILWYEEKLYFLGIQQWWITFSNSCAKMKEWIMMRLIIIHNITYLSIENAYTEKYYLQACYIGELDLVLFFMEIKRMHCQETLFSMTELGLKPKTY